MDIGEIPQRTDLILEEYYRLAPSNTPPIHIGFLIDAVSSYTECAIEVFSARWDSKQIKARLIRQSDPDRAQIIIADDQNSCWSRFSIAKELAHLIIDTQDSSVKTLEQAKKLVEDLLSLEYEFEKYCNQVKSEGWSELSAADLLFPLNLRDSYVEELESGKKAAYDIAAEFMIPVKIVENVLEPDFHKSYCDFVKSCKLKNK